MERHLSELVNRGIRLSPRTIEAFRLEHGEALGESSSEVEGIPTLGELLSFASERAEGLRLMALRTMFRLRRGEDQLNMYLRGLSPVDQRALERAREIWRVLLARLDLTTSNASTMACNDLLEALSSKGRTRLLSHW